MFASRPGPRTISRTLATRLDRYTAAWPAELPPPISATSCPAHSRPSSGDAAEGAAIQHQRRQALGSCIHRGGETRWAGADDNDVIDLVRVDRFDEPDAAGEFDIARIAQQLSIGTKNDRQFASVDMKAIDQGLRTRIGLWVEPLMRVPVA